MARVAKTAFDLLGQLEDEEDVEQAEIEVPQAAAEEAAPRMPPRPVRPVAQPRPRAPPDVSDRLTRADHKGTKMCSFQQQHGRCEHPACNYAHSTEELRESKKRLARRVAEERAKLGWVPAPDDQRHHHPHYSYSYGPGSPPAQGPAAAAAVAGGEGAYAGSGGGGGGFEPAAAPAEAQRPARVPRNFKTKLCIHYTRHNGNCSHGSHCWFAHGEAELRRYLLDEAALTAELARYGLRPQAQFSPLQQPVPAPAPAAPPGFSLPPPPHTWQQRHAAGLGPPPAPPPRRAAAPAAAGAVPLSASAQAEYLSTAAQLDDEHLPDAFICPITQELFEDPVVAADGHSYDRHAIEAWLSGQSTSPMTGEPLADTRLVPNHTLVAAIRAVVGDDACAARRMQ